MLWEWVVCIMHQIPHHISLGTESWWGGAGEALRLPAVGLAGKGPETGVEVQARAGRYGAYAQGMLKALTTCTDLTTMESSSRLYGAMNAISDHSPSESSAVIIVSAMFGHLPLLASSDIL